jgi:hypothetical protein
MRPEVRAKAAAQVRAEEPPGERRAGLLRALGYRPTPEDCGGHAQLAREIRKLRQPRHAPDSPHGLFLGLVQRWGLVIANDKRETGRLRLVLDGLALESENSALRGKRGTGDTAKANRVQILSRSKSDAMLALCRCDLSGAFAFTGRVGISVVQESPAPRIDSENLFSKPLVDLLLTSSGGLGIILDDSPKHVEWVRRKHVAGDSERVTVTIVGGDELDRINAALGD